MKTLIEIEEAIDRLPREQMFELAARLEKKAEDSWDLQFEHDAKSGRLNSIAEAALAEHRAGRSTPFPADEK